MSAGLFHCDVYLYGCTVSFLIQQILPLLSLFWWWAPPWLSQEKRLGAGFLWVHVYHFWCTFLLLMQNLQGSACRLSVSALELTISPRCSGFLQWKMGFNSDVVNVQYAHCPGGGGGGHCSHPPEELLGHLCVHVHVWAHACPRYFCSYSMSVYVIEN